jgi:hypothetical protein
MTAVTRQSRIVDRNGRPISFGYLYPTTRSNPKAYKPRYWLAKDTKQNVCEYDRLEMVDRSKQLWAQIPELSTAIRQKNNWAFGDGWDAHYFGKNRDWAREAKDWLDMQFFPFCNTRGPNYPLRESMKLMGKAWDVEGDDVMVLTETESHFPQIAFFPSTRIGNWGDPNKRNIRGRSEVKEGDYAGATIFDGVILNRHNRPIAVRILNDDGTHQDISTFNCDLGFEPDWCDQVRGIPRIAHSLLRWMNKQDIDEFIQAGIKRASAIALKVKNAEGEAAVGNEVLTAENSPTGDAAELDDTISIVGGATDRKVYREEIVGGGEVYYLDPTQNEDIEQLDFSNPHPNTEDYIRRMTRDSLASVGWHYELLDLSETGRASARLLADLANMSIWDRQAGVLRRWKRIVGYALAKGAKHGFISRPKDPRDFALWLPGFPKQLSVDAGNDVKASIDKIKFGLSTLGIEAAKDGYHPDFIRDQQENELREAFAMADRLFPLVSSKGVGYMDVVQMVRQNNPNPVTQPPQQQAA